MRTAFIVALLPLFACTGTAANTDDTSNPDGDTDGDTGTVSPPCSGGTWGAIDSVQADGAIHVSAAAASGGDGSGGSPFQTLDEAVAASREEGASRLIAVWPGTYLSFLDLATAEGDDGLAIQGCSAAEVMIEAIDDVTAVIKVSEAVGVDLRGLTLSGGKRGLWAWQGASVTLTDIEALGNRNVGIIIDGVTTTAAFYQVVVTDPLVNANAGGFGIQIQSAQVTMDDVQVTGATEHGIVVTGMDGSAAMKNVSVTGTSVNVNGEFGRGIMIQERASATIEGATLSGNSDAGLFSLGASTLDLVDVTVTNSAGAKLPGSDDTSGDGIVISDDPTGGPYEGDYFLGSADGVMIDGCARAAVLISGSGLAFEMLSAFVITNYSVEDPGAGQPVVQSDATMVDADPADYVTLDVAVPFSADPAPVDGFEP